MSAKSRCKLHYDKGCDEWSERCWLQWNSHLQKVAAGGKKKKEIEELTMDLDNNAEIGGEKKLKRKISLSMFFLGSPKQQSNIVTEKKCINNGGHSRNSSEHSMATTDSSNSTTVPEPKVHRRRSSFSFTDIRESANKVLKNRRQSLGSGIPSPESPGQQSTVSEDRLSVGYSQQLLSSAATSPEIHHDLDDWDSIAPKLEQHPNHLDDCSTENEDDDDDSDHHERDNHHQDPLNINQSADDISKNHCGYVIDCAGGSDYPLDNINDEFESSLCLQESSYHNAANVDEDGSIHDPDLQALMAEGNNCIIRPARVPIPSSPRRTEQQPTEEALVERKRVVPRTVHISQLPSCPKELAALFKVDSPSIFEGEYVSKRASSDVMFKNRYFWLSPSTRSIHWVKSTEEKWDPSHSKYILLRQCTIAKRARGHSQGVLIKAEFGPTGMLISADGGFYIELKIPEKSMNCWRKAILSLV